MVFWHSKKSVKSLIALACMALPHTAYAEATPAPQLAGRVVSTTGQVLVRSDSGAAGAAKPLRPGSAIFSGQVINTASDGTAKILLEDKTILDIGPSALFNIRKFDIKSGADRDVDMTLMYGKLRASVTKKIEGKGKFKIRTTSATMGVRGTEFIVSTSMGDLKEISHAVANPEKAQGSSAGKSADGSQTQSAKTEVVVVQGKVDVEPAQMAPKKDASGRTVANAKPPAIISLTAGQKVVADTQVDAPAPKMQTMSVAEVKAAVTSARVDDSTFKSAVVIEAASANSGKGGSGGLGGSNGRGANTASSSGGENAAMNQVVAAAMQDSAMSKPQEALAIVVAMGGAHVPGFDNSHPQTTQPGQTTVDSRPRTIHIIVK